MHSLSRRYLIQHVITTIAFVTAIGVSQVLLVLLPLLYQYSLPLLVRVLIGLLPLIPASYFPFLTVKALRYTDNRTRQVYLEMFSFSFVGTAVLTFVYGLLQSAVVEVPQLSWIFVSAVMGMPWAISGIWALRRYG